MSRLQTVPMRTQAVMDLETDEDRARAAIEDLDERKRQHALKLELFTAMNAATIAMGGPKVVAGRLDNLWSRDVDGAEIKGSVSESRYKAALDQENYNAPRVEWLIELALDPRVAEVLRRIADGKAELEAEEERDNLHEIIREEFPRQAASLIRRAKSMKKPRRR